MNPQNFLAESARILVVEDDPDLLEDTVRLLERSGYAVHRASTCAETLHMAQRFRPDVVLLDRQLPDGDGIEVCRLIKQCPTLLGTVVVMISGTFTESPQRAEGLESGADGYFICPIENRELVARVGAFVRIARLTKALQNQGEELRRTNEALVLRDRAINASTEGICLINVAGEDAELIHVNEGFERLTGYAAEEILGKSMRLLQGPGTNPEAVACLHAALANAQPCSLELLHYRKDGTPFWTRLSLAPVKNDAGAATQCIAILNDVSSNKEAEIALRKSEARVLEAHRSARMGLWELDVASQQVTWSDEVFRLFERDLLRGQPTYQEALAYYYPETSERLQKGVQLAIETGEAWEAVLHVHLPSGRDVFHNLVCRTYKNDHGDIVRLAGTVQDVTERKRAEEAVRNSEQRLKQAQAVGKIGDWQLDVRTGRLDWSDEMYRLRGRDIAAGTPTLEESLQSYFPDDARRLRESLQRAIKHGESYQLDLHLRFPDGSDAFHFAIGHAAKDPQGKVVKVYGIAQDITERRRAEERVRHLNRVYSVLSNINQAIARVWDRQTLYNAACRIAVEAGQFSAAWIGLTNEVTGEVMVTAQAGPIKEALTEVSITTRDEAAGGGPMGTAIRERRVAICNDTQTDPSFAPWRELASRLGFRSAAAFPLRIDGRTVGGFALYSNVPNFFVQEELRLLEELASDISFATEYLEKEDSRKRAEAARRESEARFTSAFQHASVGMALVAPDGELLKVNGAICSLLGYTEKELLARTFQDLTHPQDLPADLEQLHRLLTGTHSTYQMEKRYLHKSGREVWAVLSVSLVRDHLGQPLHFISQVNDITGRRESEESLRRSEERYRKLAENFPVGVVSTCNREFRITYVGGTDLAKFGATEEMFLGKHYAEIAPPEHWAIAEPFLKQAFEGETVRFQAPYRDNRYYDVTVAPLYAADGTVDEILIVSQNITEQRRAEEEIRTAHQRLAYHVENSPLALVELDSGFRVQRWSRRAEELFGWRAEEVIGRVPTEWPFVHPEDEPAVSLTLDRLLKGEELRNFSSNRNYTKDGRTVYCEWYNSALIGPGGGPVSILSLAQDVTERKQAEIYVLQHEKQLMALTARLETLREEERTRISREIHDELGQMLTGIKMDLRWMEHRLDEFSEDRRINPILDKLMEATELADATVKTVQRISAELRPEILDKLGLPLALQFEAARFEKRTGIPCRPVTPGENLPIHPECATAFFRIFQEALTNVIRHAHATVVEAELRPDPHGYRLEIRDNGVGIAQTEIEHPSSLGLLGMRERARLLGGDVIFGRGAGGGTIVVVWLPTHPVTTENI